MMLLKELQSYGEENIGWIWDIWQSSCGSKSENEKKIETSRTKSSHTYLSRRWISDILNRKGMMMMMTWLFFEIQSIEGNALLRWRKEFVTVRSSGREEWFQEQQQKVQSRRRKYRRLTNISSSYIFNEHEWTFDMNNIIVRSDTFNENYLLKFNDRSNDSMIDILHWRLKSILYNTNERIFFLLFLSLSSYRFHQSSSD